MDASIGKATLSVFLALLQGLTIS